MVKFRPLHPDTELKGQMMIDFEEAIGSEQFLPIMRKHGLDDIDPEGWYPIQQWLDVLADINESTSFLDLVSIGMQQIQNVDWPPEVLEMTLIDFLEQVVNDIYQTYYRGQGAGGLKVNRISEKEIAVVLRVPEPDNLWYGNLYAMAAKWLPPDTEAVLEYAPDMSRRDLGGDKTVIHITTDRPVF